MNREQIENRQPLFELGTINATPGALTMLDKLAVDGGLLLRRHWTGDWAGMEPEDARQNALAVKEGARILSSYEIGPDSLRIWIITEADRSTTTILLPNEY